MMQVKSFLAAAGLGAAAGVVLSLAMPQQMQTAKETVGRALHKAEQCVCKMDAM